MSVISQMVSNYITEPKLYVPVTADILIAFHHVYGDISKSTCFRPFSSQARQKINRPVEVF